MLLIYKKALSQAAFSKNPVISFSVLRAYRADVTDFSYIRFFIFMSGAGLRLLRFFFLKRIIIRVVSLREQLFQTVRRLAGNILNGDVLTDVGSVVRMALRGINVQIPYELVVDDRSLGFVFSRPLRFVHIDVVNQLVQHLFGQRPHFHELAYRVDELFPLVFLFAHFGQLPAQLQNLLLQLLTLIGIFLRKNTVVILRGLAAELVLIKRFQ